MNEKQTAESVPISVSKKILISAIVLLFLVILAAGILFYWHFSGQRLGISENGTKAEPVKDIRDDELAAFLRMTHLRSLDLSHCRRITDAGLEHLKGMTQLEMLELEGCERVTTTGVLELREALPGCSISVPNIAKRLGISEDGMSAKPAFNITDGELSRLRKMPELRALYLGYCYEITNAGMTHLAGLTQLETLYLNGCRNITEAGLAHLVGLTQMTVLSLHECDQITDARLAQLAGFTRLETLDLGWCTLITDRGLAQLMGMTQLEDLDLCGCDQVTDAGLEKLEKLTKLGKLKLLGCDRVTSAGIRKLKEALPGCHIFAPLPEPGMARRLGISEDGMSARPVADITDEELAHLREITQLEELDLRECEEITDAGVEKVKEALPRCEIIR